MSADAGAPLARPRRPFEPEQAAPDAAARVRAERFVDRELDVLAEQGNFERARVLLARRAAAGAADTSSAATLGAPSIAEVYLDAIRVERSAAPAGAAWQAWASRAFAQGVEVAGTLAALVPARELCAYLIGQDVGWASLGRQRDRAAARALLSLRLEQQLRDDPVSALAAVDDRALRAAAAEDAALRALVIGVIAGAVWDARDSALAIAKSYAIDADAAAIADDVHDGAETLARRAWSDALRLQPAWIAATRMMNVATGQTSWPGALARFVRSGPLASRAALAQLARELRNDLRARPADYLACADALARHAPELGAWLIAECDAGRDALAAGRDVTVDQAAAEHALAAALGELRSQQAHGAWLGVVWVSAAALLATWPWATAARAAIAAIALLAPWWLRRTLDRRLYARVLRPALLDAIVRHGASPAALRTTLRARGTVRGRALAAYAERDRGLAIASALAAFAQAEAGESAASAAEAGRGRNTEQVRS